LRLKDRSMIKTKGIFYGWWIVVVTGALAFSLNTAPFNIVLKLLMEHFHTGRGEVSVGQSIYVIAGGIGGVVAGHLLQHHRSRIFILWGCVVFGVSSILLSLSNNLWYFYIFCCISGGSTGFWGVIGTFTLLSKWFTRKWGMALGISQMGGFIGSLVLSPVVGLIAQNLGWRATYIFAGLFVMAVDLPLILLVAKESAQSVGLLQDGDQPAMAAPADKERLPDRKAAAIKVIPGNRALTSYLKEPDLWLMCFCFAFIAVGYSVVVTHEVSMMTDMKVSAAVASSALGFTLGIGAVSSLAAGWLADRFSSRYVVIFFTIIALAGMLLLMRAESTSIMWVAVLVFGLGVGASGTLLPIVTREIFGSANFSAVFGITNVMFLAGFALGAPLAGYIFDYTGSYHGVFVIVSVIYLIAILFIYLSFGLKPRPFRNAPVLQK
jgi:MFS family permease